MKTTNNHAKEIGGVLCFIGVGILSGVCLSINPYNWILCGIETFTAIVVLILGSMMMVGELGPTIQGECKNGN